MSMFGVCTNLMENDVVIVKLWMISWLNFVVVVMECVVDELMHWVFIIVDWWCELGCCWKFWWNFVELLNYVEMMFWFKVLCNFECLLMYIYLQTTFRNEFGCWEIKIRVLGWKMVWTREKFCRTDDSSLKRAASEMSPVATGRISLKRVLLRSSEMLSDNMPCFAFLCLFRMFPFWIGFLYEHESFR